MDETLIARRGGTNPDVRRKPKQTAKVKVLEAKPFPVPTPTAGPAGEYLRRVEHLLWEDLDSARFYLWFARVLGAVDLRVPFRGPRDMTDAEVRREVHWLVWTGGTPS